MKKFTTPILIFFAITTIVTKFLDIFKLDSGSIIVIFSVAIIWACWTYHIWRNSTTLVVDEETRNFTKTERYFSLIGLVLYLFVSLYILYPTPKSFGVNIYYDDTFERDSLQGIYKYFRQSNIHVSFIPYRFPNKETINKSDRNEIFKTKNESGLNDFDGKKISIFLTHRNLEGKYSHLLATISKSGAFLSTYDIDVENYQSLNDVGVEKYVAVSIVLRSIQVLIKPEQIFRNANEDATSDCFYEFSKLRNDFVEKTRNPYLCAREADVIKRKLGQAYVDSINKVFENINRL